MTIKVYYTELNSLFANKIRPVLNDVKDNLDRSLLKCPAFTDYLRNTFVVTSPEYYNLHWVVGEKYYTDIKSQEFFNENVNVRDVDTGLCSILLAKYFFFAERPLIMQQKPAEYHRNEFTKNVALLGGEYDVGRHFRWLESSFYFKEPSITIEQDDALYYIKFCTTEKVKLIPFQFTDQLRALTKSVLSIKTPERPKPLDFWYNINTNFYRKKMLSIIKQNTLV